MSGIELSRVWYGDAWLLNVVFPATKNMYDDLMTRMLLKCAILVKIYQIVCKVLCLSTTILQNLGRGIVSTQV